MTDRQRLAHALARLASAQIAHVRRSGRAIQHDGDELSAARAAFAAEVNRAGLSQSDVDRLADWLRQFYLDQYPAQDSAWPGDD